MAPVLSSHTDFVTVLDGAFTKLLEDVMPLLNESLRDPFLTTLLEVS